MKKTDTFLLPVKAEVQNFESISASPTSLAIPTLTPDVITHAFELKIALTSPLPNFSRIFGDNFKDVAEPITEIIIRGFSSFHSLIATSQNVSPLSLP